MKLKNKICLTIIMLLILLGVSVSVLQNWTDCTLRVYYVNGNSGATIKTPKTYAGKWLNRIDLNMKIDGYTLTNQVSRKQTLTFGNKSIVLKYVAQQNQRKINQNISNVKYLGVSSIPTETRQVGTQQIASTNENSTMRILTSKDGSHWKTLPLNYPNVSMHNPKIVKSAKRWLIVSDNQLLSTNDFSKWKYRKLTLGNKRFSGIYNPSITRSGNDTFIVFKSWKRRDQHDAALYYAKLNTEKLTIGIPKKMDVNYKASKLDGFSIKYIDGKLILIGVDAKKNQILMYQSVNVESHFNSIQMKQHHEDDNLSNVNLTMVGGNKRLYYSSYGVHGGIKWHYGVSYIDNDNQSLDYSKAKQISSNQLVSNLNVIENK